MLLTFTLLEIKTEKIYKHLIINSFLDDNISINVNISSIFMKNKYNFQTIKTQWEKWHCFRLLADLRQWTLKSVSVSGLLQYVV